MSRLRNLSVAAAASLALSACSSDSALPTAPAATPSLEVVNPAVVAAAVTRPTRLDRDVTVGAWIDAEGGSIEIKKAGLKVEIPGGALRQRTYITATALAGDMYAYDFGPHGTVFARPLRVEVELNKRALQRTHLERIEVGYFAKTSQLDERANSALINEFLPVVLDLHGSKVRFEVWHFSGYMVSSGRNK